MKGKLLQKSIALMLVLCMTMVNFIFVATNVAYALSNSTQLEGGNIVFKAYYKGVTSEGKTVNTSTKVADVNEGDNLYFSLLVKQGKLQDAKVKIENANFKIDEEKVDKTFVKNIIQNGLTKEIAFNEISYTDCNGDAIEIELPVKFEEAKEIETSYFDMENKITLSGNYINSSENGKNITSEDLRINLQWTELEDVATQYTPQIEKIIYLENATLVQYSLSSTFTSNYFPKETEIVTFNLPKVEGVTPSYTILVNGDKVDKNDITAPVGSEEISYTNNFIKDGKIKWNTAGDVYKIIYKYDGITDLADPVEVKASIQQKLFNRNMKDKKSVVSASNVEKGTISTVDAKATSTDVYKGYMYANSAEKDTEYKETYNLEISYVDGITAELNLKDDKFKTETEDLSTNNKTEYKEISINKANLLKVLGTTGTLKIMPENTELSEITINKDSAADENGNIVISQDKIKNSHNVKFEVSNAENEGTIEINTTKAIKGNAGYEREALNQIKAIETTVETRTNKDKENNTSTSTVTTELKETTTKVRLEMDNNNILSTINTNKVNFKAYITTGTIDADSIKNPTIRIQLPEEVTEIANVAANVLYAEDTLNKGETSIDGKSILVKLDGEQVTNNNAFVEGIMVSISADVKLDSTVTTKNTEIKMTYTNENSAQGEYTMSIPVSIVAPEDTTGTKEDSNPSDTQPSTQQPVEGTSIDNEILKVDVYAIGNNKEIKAADEVYENQVLRYIYRITNKSNEDITDVKLVANHENTNVFEQITKSQEVTFEAVYEEETEKSNLERTIGTIKPEETKMVTYQVRVKEGVNNTKANVTISGTGIENIAYASENAVKPAELKLEVGNNRSKDFALSEGENLYNRLSITNTSDNTLNNITVSVKVPSEFKVEKIFESEAETENNIEYTTDNNNVSFRIDKLGKDETATYAINLLMKEKRPTREIVRLKFSATVNDKEYYSNDLEIGIAKSLESSVLANLTSNITEDTLKNGDNLSFAVDLKNTSEVEDVFLVKFSLPNAAPVKRAYVINEQQTVEQEIDVNNIDLNTIIEAIDINKNGEKQLVVETQIDESKTPNENIEFYATVSGSLLPESVDTNKITYKLMDNITPVEEFDDEDSENPENPEDPENPDDPSTPGTVEVKHSISGVVWLDKNKNGIKESSEDKLSGVRIILADVENNNYVKDEKGNIVEKVTNSDGEYKFDNLPNGKYMVVFAFDNTKYRNTQYHETSATDATNSDIETSKLLTNNTETKYGVTNTLVLKDGSLQNIDAGLIENEIFDLSINKYISKVTIQNSAGTTVKEYNKEKLAKLEIDSKVLAGSTLLIEYQVDVKNEGEIAGYVNEIIDYMPKDLKFNSELNNDWYMSTDGNLHTNTLAKELIEPGETKTITVILTKTMTENNTGLTSNKVEIAKSTNELLIPDSKVNNNTSTGELIVSIRTGVEVTIGIIITLIAIATTGIIVYAKARKGASHE